MHMLTGVGAALGRDDVLHLTGTGPCGMTTWNSKGSTKPPDRRIPSHLLSSEKLATIQRRHEPANSSTNDREAGMAFSDLLRERGQTATSRATRAMTAPFSKLHIDSHPNCSSLVDPTSPTNFTATCNLSDTNGRRWRSEQWIVPHRARLLTAFPLTLVHVTTDKGTAITSSPA